MENKAKRIPVGVAAVLVVVLSAFWMPLAGICVLLVAISSLALWEFYNLLDLSGVKPFKGLGLLFGAMLITATWASRALETGAGWEPEPALLAVIVMVMCVRLLAQKNNDKPVVAAACTLFGVLYVSFLFNYLTKLLFAWESGDALSFLGATGRLFFFYLLAVVKTSDIGAYFIGSKWGRRKLIPRISPAKTLEGCAGGIAAGLAGSLIFLWVSGGRMGVVRMDLIDAVVLGLFLPLLGIAGDLAESILKRSAGKKDSSSILPGLGGLLDVLDSLLFTVPALYLYAVYVIAPKM